MNSVACNFVSKLDQLLGQPNVVVKDRGQLNDKLQTLVVDSADKLRVIADFDSTLTKSVVDGKPTSHSLEIFACTKSLSQRYRDGCKALEAKYGPQVSKEKTEQELQLVYNKWWDDHEQLSAGETITRRDIEAAVDAVNTPLRDGCKEMLNLLSEHKVPVVVVSAGLGEVVSYTLREFKLEIVSNFIRFDESGHILGFTKPTVSLYNKHKMPLPVSEGRDNVILLGDSLGDSTMANAVLGVKTVLKVGFFIGEDKQQLQRYCSSFDVVVMNDQTMNIVTAIIKMILGSS